jgi:hypothetical protein
MQKTDICEEIEKKIMKAVNIQRLGRKDNEYRITRKW